VLLKRDKVNDKVRDKVADNAGQRIGLFGGSFDPVHNGHLLVAMAACEELDLARLYFIPAAQSPFKPQQVPAPAETRLRSATSTSNVAVISKITRGPSSETSHPSFTFHSQNRIIRRFGRSSTSGTLTGGGYLDRDV